MGDFWTPIERIKARKKHYCNTCSRRIDPGETYGYATGNYDGSWISFRQCAHCLAISKIYNPIDDEGLVSPSAFDWWSEDPRDVTELRYVVQWRKQWRRNDGTLLPVPACEQVDA